MESLSGVQEVGNGPKGLDTPPTTVGSESPHEIPSDFKLELFVKKVDRYETIPYTKEFGQIIAGFTAQNISLSAIAKIPGMPSVLTIKQWIRKEAEFSELMMLAEQARAEVLADTALQVASESVWQNARSDKIKVETALRLAAAYDPNKFASKQKISSEHHETLTFFIDTGFQHPGESRRLKPIDIETRDPSVVLREENERNQVRLPAPSGSIGTQETTQEILGDSGSPPVGEVDLLPEQHD